MTDIKPLYIDGKRDSRRRYVLPSGEIISRRQHIKITEGASPESKAYARYLRGLAPKGITAKKYERRLKRKQETKAEEPTTVPTPKPIKEEWGWKEVPLEPRGYYQLQGRYRVRNTKTGETTTVTGYSTATITKRGGQELQILRSQAVDHGKAQLDDYDWVLVGIEYEVWLKW